ncbi:MAG TPA: hypothetical protein VMU83_00630 [Hanamia sp.]|nr:hypothetical protein [Hanamia sp.]
MKKPGTDNRLVNVLFCPFRFYIPAPNDHPFPREGYLPAEKNLEKMHTCRGFPPA